MNRQENDTWYGVAMGLAQGVPLAYAAYKIYDLFLPAVPIVSPGQVIGAVGATAGAIGAAELLKKRKERRIDWRVERVFDLVFRKDLPRPKRVKVRAKGNITTLDYLIPIGYELKDFYDNKGELEQATGGQMEIEARGNFLKMVVYHNQLLNRIEYETPPRVRKSYPVLNLGYSVRGLEKWDIKKDPHLLCGSTTGGGKTTFLKYLVMQLLENYTEDEAQIVIIDPKGVDFPRFGKLDRVKLAIELDDVEELLCRVEAEMDYRLRLFAQADCVDIFEFNKQNKMPFIFCIIDEFAEFKKPMVKVTERLLRLGRAAGVALVPTTQRPDAEVFPGGLKANVSATIAFKCRDEVNSRILLGNAEAFMLPKVKGRAVLQTDGNWKLQVPYVSPEYIDRYIQATKPIPVLTKE